MGAGHTRTAEAIKKAAELSHPETEVIIVDTFRYASPFLEKVVLGTYMEMLKVTPVVYGYLYRQAERGRPLSGRGKLEFNRLLNILAAPRLEHFINEYQPDGILCTHPFPLGIISFMKKKGSFSGPLFATITDFTIHSFWIFPEVDYYFLGAEAIRPQCEDFGVEPKRLRVTGIPIDPAFNDYYDKYQLRRDIGLNPELPTILIMGGGLGMGPLASAVKTLSSGEDNCQLLVVAGTNNALREKLNKMTDGLESMVKVFGFVDNTHHLMAASDFMVGKAGGLTCAEAISMGLPLIIVDPLPGQEERNTEFMVAAGAAVRVEEKELALMVQSFLSGNDRLLKMSKASASLGKPKASDDVMRIIADAVSA